MELIHNLLNLILVPSVFFALIFFLPPYYFIKFLFFIKRSKHPENVAGKVVLITGASSGIGENLAYEYARRGARLALVARREDRLRAVLDKARHLGSPDAIMICADVSKVEDCERFIHHTLDHFAQLDHLVNNAGILQCKLFKDLSPKLSDLAPILDVNFWGSVYPTHFAIPHLRKSRGKIVVISSIAAWYPTPKLSFYNGEVHADWSYNSEGELWFQRAIGKVDKDYWVLCCDGKVVRICVLVAEKSVDLNVNLPFGVSGQQASKAALNNFFATLRAEFGSDIGITVVTPGVIQSEMVENQFKPEIDLGGFPIRSSESCAKAIVDSACRGDLHLTEPFWARILIWIHMFCPALLEWCLYKVVVRRSAGAAKKSA